MKTKQEFHVKNIFFATIPPYDEEKKLRNKLLKYKIISEPGNTSDYLFDIFDKASDDCKVEIIFQSDQSQNNPVRALLIDLVSSNNINKKTECFVALTRRMYTITDERNGMGLFVLIEGKKDAETRLMLCRFRGSEALHNDGDALNFLSQVFTKQTNHYKLAVFQDIVSSKSFWKGFAIDRQTASNNYKPFSFFWIEDFLQAETAITNAQGTLQFSKILKNVLNSTSKIEEKEQIISAIINLKSKPSSPISLKAFSDQYLSGEVSKDFEKQTNNDVFFNSTFSIDTEVLQKQLGSTVIVLQDGVTAFVPTFSYQDHVKEQNTRDGEKKITIEGFLKDKHINVRKEKRQLKNKPNKKEKR